MLLVILSHLEYKGILLESFWFLHTWIHICHHSSDCFGKETDPTTDYEKAEPVSLVLSSDSHYNNADVLSVD